jgi:putative membrane-bound dehydrogenase-like protein
MAVGTVAVLSLLVVADLRSGHAAEFKLNGHTFTLPDGFEMEQVAGPPLVDRPIVADFDDAGRLYVADSSGSNDSVKQQLETRPHRIMRLEDTDGDGRYDKSVVFADKMMFPEGAMWFDGSLYVGAPPSIWKLTDTDGDGVADQREEWFNGHTLTGCANDLHGPYLGPDGWIYWCKGAFATQEYDRPDGSKFVTRAAHIFRRRPEGGFIEPVMTGGMDNPVEVAFTPEGERIFTTTFLQHPGGGHRDGLIHAVYGGVYGKIHDVIDEHPRTGDVMPVLTHLGPAAPCGLTRYQSRIFGADFQNNLFACLFNLHKVTRHVLTRSGATFSSRDSDFLVSDSVDFHPTDVLEDADGSLIVVDTGGWYKICCPTSQLYKPDVLGAIYRIRRQGAPLVPDPRGQKMVWKNRSPQELAGLLDDPRPAVNRRAQALLAKEPKASLPVLEEMLKDGKTAGARRNAVWVLTRIDQPQARQAVRPALDDADESVQLAALHSTSLWRDRGALTPLRALLRAPSAPLQRAAAEALGRIGEADAVPDLLAAASQPHGRVLEHSLIYALIEIADPTDTAAGLAAKSSFTKRAAMMALDQMKGGGLKPDQVVASLSAPEPALKDTALWILNRHPNWAGAVADYFAKRLTESNLPEAERNELPGLLARFAPDKRIRIILAQAAGNASSPKASRSIALEAMARSSLKNAPREWTDVLITLMKSPQPELVRQAVETARSLPAPRKDAADFGAELLRLGRDSRQPDDLRLKALAAFPGGLTEVQPATFDFLCAHLDPGRPVTIRSEATRVLTRARLSPVQLTALTGTLKQVGPLELSKLLPAFDQSHDEKVGTSLLTALKSAPAFSSLHPDLLRPRLTNFPAVVQKAGEELLAALNTDAGKQKAHLEELMASLKNGDIRRGQAVFNSTKAACSSCHAIGYLGGKVGPDLTRIGQIRTERDLLEAVVYPSASFVRSYEPVVVATKDGEDYSGVVRNENADELVLATGPGAEVRIARRDVTEMRPGTVSVMPSGLDEVLTHQELADLLAFLKATRR